MKMLFLGGVFSKEMEEDILKKSKGTVHYAANKLQWNLIDGLLNSGKLDLKVISAPFVGTYPKEYSGLFFEEQYYIYQKAVQCESVKFCNLWGYRSISRSYSLKRQIRSFIQEQASNKVIIVYSPHTPFLKAAVYAKQKDPSIHICLIVPDLPQFMNLMEGKSVIYKMLKKIDLKIFETNSKHIDSFVLLTNHMKDMLNVGKRPYVVVEGVVNKTDTFLEKTEIKGEDIKTVVYTGTLSKKFGVVNLIKAFHAIDNPYAILKLCGSGDAEDIIKKYAKKDHRIHFLGQLSNEEAVKLQKNATVLVNPRQNNEEYTKYSFPSKNMEYLLSGNPVVAYKLDGIPDEYDDYLFYVKDNSLESFSSKISEVLNLTSQDRNDFGKRARHFVINNKNNNEASSKIIKMIKSN
ncbi:glycosyltransferase [Peribacillus frigoritolerans]|uniref:glycosyltransferase n=1 Tax=Peribacillus castrilensis TaxID=2897690 RepID=UPI003DA64770